MIPANATDCHHHIYGARYKLDPRLSRITPDANVADYLALAGTLGLARNVIVHPSAYGTDNSCTLDALAAFGPRARAVAVVDTTVTDAALAAMHAAGVRGIRFNLVQIAATTPAMLAPLAARVHELGWHIQLNVTADQVVALADTLAALPCPVVFDHCGHIPPGAGVAHPAFAAITRLLATGRAWVKLSGAYLDSTAGPPAYADITPIAQAYARAAPARVVWGSDWPHPSAHTPPDDVQLLAMLSDWVPDEAARHRVLVDNPAELYDFPR